MFSVRFFDFSRAFDSSQITFAGSDVSSTSRVVPLPASNVTSPRAKDSSSYDAGLKLYQQQPLLFVPKELYLILRRENLLKYKKYFVPFKIEDVNILFFAFKKSYVLNYFGSFFLAFERQYRSRRRRTDGCIG